MDPFHNPVIFIFVIVLLVWVVKIVYDWLEKTAIDGFEPPLLLGLRNE